MNETKRCACGWIFGVSMTGLAAATSSGQEPCRRFPAVMSAADTGLRAALGESIQSVDVVTTGPRILAGSPLGVLAPLHVRTRASTVRDVVLLSPGDVLDSTSVAESLRRLRELGLFNKVSIEARSCGTGVHLTIRTRDVWSTGAELRMRASGAAQVGLRERNLFGTGVSASLTLRSHNARIGIAASIRHPLLFGGRVIASADVARFTDGELWSLQVSRRPRGLVDPWRADLNLAHSAREASSLLGDAFERTRGSLLGGRLLTGRRAATSLYALAGVETEQAELASAPTTRTVGPTLVRRAYAGPLIGLTAIAARHDEVRWLLPDGAVADVPRGIEGEIVGGIGRDEAAGSIPQGAVHFDGWAGATWSPGKSLLLVDVWGSAYLRDEQWNASTVRALITAFHQARRGFWKATLGLERLIRPDPDVRALATIDPTAAMLAPETRLAEAGASASLERAVHLRAICKSYRLDGALFGATSYRWGSPNAVHNERIGIGVLGAGLRFAPSVAGRATVRLDAGYPVWWAGNERRRPLLAVSVSPWFSVSRHRDGRPAP